MRTGPRPRVVARQHLADLDLAGQVALSLAEFARSATEHLLSLSVAVGPATLQELFADELAGELTADLGHWLREVPSHVIERRERVLSALAREEGH